MSHQRNNRPRNGGTMSDGDDQSTGQDRLFEQGWARAMSGPAPSSDSFPEGSFGQFAGMVGFEHVWNREVLTTRERRLIILTVLACFGRDDITQLHMGSALDLGDLDGDDLNEMAVTIGAYAGLPRGVAFNALAQRLLAERSRDEHD